MTMIVDESRFVKSLKSVGAILYLMFTILTNSEPIANVNGHIIANRTG